MSKGFEDHIKIYCGPRKHVKLSLHHRIKSRNNPPRGHERHRSGEYGPLRILALCPHLSFKFNFSYSNGRKTKFLSNFTICINVLIFHEHDNGKAIFSIRLWCRRIPAAIFKSYFAVVRKCKNVILIPIRHETHINMSGFSDKSKSHSNFSFLIRALGDMYIFV